VRIRTFLRGQVILAFGFSVVLAVAFTIVRGVPFRSLFGFLIGVASMLPFMGAIAQVSVSAFLMVNNLIGGNDRFCDRLRARSDPWQRDRAPRHGQHGGPQSPLVALHPAPRGIKVAGLSGILLAIPVASTVSVIADESMATQSETGENGQDDSAPQPAS